MKIFNLIKLLVIALSLTACGGGSSGDNPENSAPLSFQATTNTLFGFDENAEPMDMSVVTVNSDADDNETAFDDILNQTTDQ